MKKQVLLLLTLITLSCSLAFAAEPVQKWISDSTIKPSGEAWCDGKLEHQNMSVVATMKDDKGNATTKELSTWDQLTGKACDAKPRGMMPAKPNMEKAAEAEKAVKAEMAKPKSRGCNGRPTYYLYWEYANYTYIEWYDNCWNYLGYEYRY